MLKRFIPIAIIVIFPILLISQTMDDAIKNILKLQDERSPGNGKLVAYLQHTQPVIRFHAAIALGNIQDETTVKTLIPLLRDPDSTVRAAAAFALGQIASPLAQDSLLTQLSIERVAPVVTKLTEALGKLGDEQALYAIAEMETKSKPASYRYDAALSLSRFARRDIKNERAVWCCLDLLIDADPAVRWAALFSLTQMNPYRMLDIELSKRVDDLKTLCNDPAAEVRTQLAAMLGATKAEESASILSLLRSAEQKKNDWKVQVQLAQAYGNKAVSDGSVLPSLSLFLNSTNSHVLIAALQSWSRVPVAQLKTWKDTTAFKRTLLALASTPNKDAVMIRGEAIATLAKLFPSEFLKANFSANRQLTVLERTKVIEGYSYISSGKSFLILLDATDDSVRVAMTAWDNLRLFLAQSARSRIQKELPNWDEVRGQLYEKALRSLQRGDIAIMGLVANAIGDSTVFTLFNKPGESENLIQALSQGYSRLHVPDDVEPMRFMIMAMGRLKDKRFLPLLEKAMQTPNRTISTIASVAIKAVTGAELSSKILETAFVARQEEEFKELSAIKADQRIVITTNKGIIKIQLLKEDAPFTVLSFIRLVEKKFYDGLLFHRVVPGFVIQGGDPRRDGWGGPGYSIRTEISLQNYQRGMVGMASSGKDTEGCQFFITHTAAPRLDGRYTIFGKVIEGMDVVDKIQIGDLITSITRE
ncbi:MAG: peptidylprolyl isomerase [bacterium]